MNKHHEELSYAIDESGNLLHISCIPVERRGKKCGCSCPKCKAGLYAKLGSGELNGRKPHFAHEPDSDCHGAGMTILHMLAEQIIEEEKAVMAPSYKSIPHEILQFKEVEVEKRVDRKDLQPDIVGITEDGQRWHIEIKNTNEIKEIKKGKLVESHITCLEIDVSNQPQDKGILKDFLINSIKCREWINNPIYDRRIEEKEKKDRAEVEDKLASYDESKYDIRDESYCRNNCQCYEGFGLCVCQINKFRWYKSTLVVCDKELKNKNIERARNKKRTISPIYNARSHQRDLDICVEGLSLHDICYKIMKEYQSLTIDGHNVIAIENMNISSRSDGILLFCRCNDRIPYKVVAIWIESGSLRYNIVCSRKEKSYDDASKIYESARFSLIEIDKLDQDNVLDGNNCCVF